MTTPIQAPPTASDHQKGGHVSKSRAHAWPVGSLSTSRAGVKSCDMLSSATGGHVLKSSKQHAKTMHYTPGPSQLPLAPHLAHVHGQHVALLEPRARVLQKRPLPEPHWRPKLGLRQVPAHPAQGSAPGALPTRPTGTLLRSVQMLPHTRCWILHAGRPASGMALAEHGRYHAWHHSWPCLPACTHHNEASLLLPTVSAQLTTQQQDAYRPPFDSKALEPTPLLLLPDRCMPCNM